MDKLLIRTLAGVKDLLDSRHERDGAEWEQRAIVVENDLRAYLEQDHVQEDLRQEWKKILPDVDNLQEYWEDVLQPAIVHLAEALPDLAGYTAPACGLPVSPTSKG